ncbi:conserved hypothetical protein [Sporisorium reilianum SRZ2]|uniref:Uncharacterized protein n=2 Tax=Sporisorium reilianum TaxID=72558 RepID=E6ZKV1_SPORE|nr:conserved hypothetical protein [Sporisorium reilianum SRZ2]SJX60591.1 uncharacterized protein SRS1_11820 [Sporisorium reilianum f. sp. reilianum]
MSSKNKLTKFKNAVSASSSASPPPSSSTKPSSSNPPLTTTQANTLQALHQEQLARLAATTLPNLAAAHSRRFLHLARTQTHNADAMWSAQKVHAVRFRRSLWAEDVEPEPEVEMGKGKEGRVVPDFYDKHNARCARCALPLVAGLNCVSVKGHVKGREGKKRRQGRKAKRISCCTLCHHKTRTS